MKKKSVKLLAALAVSLFAAQIASAAAVDVLVNKLAAKGLITRGEAQQIMVESGEEERSLANSGKNPMVPMWVQKLKLSGDLRLRTQFDYGDATNGETRIRERVRLRLGVETMASDKVKMGFGIASGDTVNGFDKNPTSTNHTFNGFNKVPVFIDYAYLNYEPVEWASITAGKVKNKTQAWSTSDLVWDTDINPDGLSVALNGKAGGAKVFANAGAYVLGEQRYATGVDSGMANAMIVQPGIDFKLGKIGIKAAVAYEQFNVKGRKLNSNEAGAWMGSQGAADYSLITPSVEVKFGEVIASKHLSIFGDYVKNTNDNDDAYEDNTRTGFLYGFSFGAAKVEKFADWQVKGMYRRLEANALPLGLGDSDAGYGKGYEATLAFGLLKNLTFDIDYYDMTDIDGEARRNMLQLDFNYKI